MFNRIYEKFEGRALELRLIIGIKQNRKKIWHFIYFIHIHIEYKKQITIFFNMHEMSIALQILKIAETELEKVKGEKIEKIHLSVGKLSGIVIESLEFALEASQKEGHITNAEIVIDEIPARMKCLHCTYEFEADDFYITCPKCNHFEHEILSGKELLINSLTIS